MSNKNAFSKLWCIIEDVCCKGQGNLLVSHIEKELYQGPYLYREDRDVHRFRIYNIFRSLSYAMQSFKTPGADKAQILIDRFSMSHENEANALWYLRTRLQKYYPQIEIGFIDSRCCDYLQLIDVVITLVDEKLNFCNPKFASYNIDFIHSKNFTT